MPRRPGRGRKRARSKETFLGGSFGDPSQDLRAMTRPPGRDYAVGEALRNKDYATANRMNPWGGRFGPDTGTPSFKRGGTMKRRGVARLHKGERIMGRKDRGRSR